MEMDATGTRLQVAERVADKVDRRALVDKGFATATREDDGHWKEQLSPVRSQCRERLALAGSQHHREGAPAARPARHGAKG